MEMEMRSATTTQKPLPDDRRNKSRRSPPNYQTKFGAGAKHVIRNYRPSRTALGGFLILSICVAFFGQRALAQSIDSSALNVFDRSSNLHDPHELSHLNDPNDRNRHFTSTGKLCIALESRATAQRMNKDIYEHWIIATNSCGQNIKIQVCYHKTDDCIVMNVPPWESTNSILGIYPNVRDFQYDAREK
jgi:hypothetical protein